MTKTATNRVSKATASKAASRLTRALHKDFITFFIKAENLGHGKGKKSPAAETYIGGATDDWALTCELVPGWPSALRLKPGVEYAVRVRGIDLGETLTDLGSPDSDAIHRLTYKSKARTLKLETPFSFALPGGISRGVWTDGLSVTDRKGVLTDLREYLVEVFEVVPQVRATTASVTASPQLSHVQQLEQALCQRIADQGIVSIMDSAERLFDEIAAAELQDVLAGLAKTGTNDPAEAVQRWLTTVMQNDENEAPLGIGRGLLNVARHCQAHQVLLKHRKP